MSDIFFKIKKYAVAIVVVVILATVFSSVILVSLNSARNKSTSYAPQSLNLSNPLGGISDSLRESPANKNSVSYAAEGQLTERKIVKNGSLSLLVKKAEETAQSISSVADEFGGFISDSKIYEVSSGIKSGTVTIRVPADKFGDALAKIKKLAVKVETEEISAQDVTEKYIDLEAQIRNLQAEEVQYLEIMKRAFSVQETLNVAQKLSEVRGNIERVQGQLQFLSRQVDMSTITVSLTAESDIEVFGISWRPFFVVKQAFRGMLSGLANYADAMIRILLQLPVVMLWLITILFFLILAWKITKWIRRKFFPSDQQN